MKAESTQEKRLTAKDITRLLSEKHKEDVFVDQCKDGPSHSGGLLILDGWAMKKSWANPCITGYEIKISRSDFARDDKWYGYLPYCNEFYFVCPAGMLKPEEIPEPAGLLCASKTGGVLFKKKKATRREVEPSPNLYKYILMTRAKITREQIGTSKLQFWEEWLATETIDQNFGHRVRGRLGKVIQERILNVERENKSLVEKMRRYDGLRETLRGLDLDPDRSFIWERDVEERVKRVRSAVPQELRSALASTQKLLSEFHQELAKLETPSPQEKTP
jgi:hypothetical protein